MVILFYISCRFDHIMANKSKLINNHEYCMYILHSFISNMPFE
jgi:hypothetical protein